MADTALTIPEGVDDLLTKRERDGYREQLANRFAEPVPQGLADQAWHLFMAGQNCESIAGTLALKLGQIVRLRVEKGWDERLEEHRQWQASNARAQHQQSHLQSLTYVQTGIAAAVILSEIRLLKFIATRDLSELRPEDIAQLENSAQIKQWIELSGKLSGQTPSDGTTRIEGKVEHVHTVEPVLPPAPAEDPWELIQAELKARRSQQK